MKKDNPKRVDIVNPKLREGRVHQILAHSYALYLLALIGGLFLDFLFPVKFFKSSIMIVVGFVFLIPASLLIFWAQKTSHNLKMENVTVETFCRGPYCYTRSPTHWGLLFLILGFGVIVGAPFLLVSTILAFIVNKFVFVSKMESHLLNKYGEPYSEYKKIVKF